MIAGNHRIQAKRHIQAEAAKAKTEGRPYGLFDPRLVALKLHDSITDVDIMKLSECTSSCSC